MTAYASSDEDNKIIAENVDYVLGMYDLYNNDQDIISALHLKGINNDLVLKILHIIKQPAYEKRIKQSIKMIKRGAALIILFTAIYFIFSNLPGSKTFLEDHGNGESVFIFFFKIYREFFYFFLFGSVMLFLAGIIQFKKYTKLLKSEEGISR